MLEFRILGPVAMMRDGRPVDVPQQARTVLAQLLLAEERAVSTDRLMDALWGERVPLTARAAMHNLVAALRRALGEDADMLTTQAPGYALRYGSRATFDLQEFEAEIDQGRSALESANPGQAEAMLSTALARWQGDALADLAYESWATPVAERLEELRIVAAELRIEAMLALGQSTKAIGETRSLLVAHPLRESLHAHLLRGLMSAGRRSEALDAYRDWYGLTTSELGLEPSRELRDLQHSLLEDEPSPPRGPAFQIRAIGRVEPDRPPSHSRARLSAWRWRDGPRTDPSSYDRPGRARRGGRSGPSRGWSGARGDRRRAPGPIGRHRVVRDDRGSTSHCASSRRRSGLGRRTWCVPGGAPLRAMQRGCARELAVRRRSHPDGSGARALRRGRRRMVGTRDRSVAGAGKRRASADFRRSARG